MGWSNLTKTIKKMSEDMVEEVRNKAAEEMLESLTIPASYHAGIDGITPVDSGNLMANNIVSIDIPDYSTNDLEDPSGSKTFSEGISKVLSANPYSVIYIQNNTPYNINAEFEGWGATPAYMYFSKSINNTFNLVRRLK